MCFWLHFTKCIRLSCSELSLENRSVLHEGTFQLWWNFLCFLVLLMHVMKTCQEYPLTVLNSSSRYKRIIIREAYNENERLRGWKAKWMKILQLRLVWERIVERVIKLCYGSVRKFRWIAIFNFALITQDPIVCETRVAKDIFRTDSFIVETIYALHEQLKPFQWKLLHQIRTKTGIKQKEWVYRFEHRARACRTRFNERIN